LHGKIFVTLVGLFALADGISKLSVFLCTLDLFVEAILFHAELADTILQQVLLHLRLLEHEFLGVFVGGVHLSY